MSIDKLILAGVRGSDPETGMNTFHEFLCVRASDYDEALARIAQLEAEQAAIERALPHLLDFRLEPKFDAKGTYTQAKADEWTKRIGDFKSALQSENEGGK